MYFIIAQDASDVVLLDRGPRVDRRARDWPADLPHPRSASVACGARRVRLKRLAGGWHEVDPTDAVREAAVRLLRVHPLRAAGALQLAAAFVAAERRPSSLEVVTLDDRLAGAARKEGFVLVTG